VKYTFGVRPILILLVLISMGPVFVALVQTSISEQERALEKAMISLKNQTQLRANSQVQMLEGVRHMLTVIAHSPSIHNAKPQECDRYLHDLKEHFPRYAHLAFADKGGNLVCGSALERGKVVYVGDRQYFKGAVRTGRFTVGEYVVSRVLGTPSIAISLPVYLPGGELQGVQYAVLELTGVQEQFRAVSVPLDVTDVITDANGIVLASAGNRTKRVGERLADGFLTNAVRSRQSVVDKALDHNGQEWLYAVQFVNTEGAGGLAVSSMMSSDSVLGPVVQRLQLELAMLLVLALAASLLAWRMADRLLAAPIERLLAKVRALEQGDTGAAQPADTDRNQVHELRQIDRGINDLAAALSARSSQRDLALAEIQEQKKSLERSEHRYRAQFEASPQPMWVFDTETLAFLVVNDAAVAHYGYAREEFMKMTLADIHPPTDIPLLVESLRQSGAAAREGILGKHRRKNGDVIDVEISSHSLDWDGRPSRMTIAYDVTSRVLAKQAWERLHETLEHKVAQRTSELELANEELEAFSYSVSHDLRGPLHTIDGFCAALLERHSNALPPPAIHYLGRIRAGTVQMNTLIADLLSFARTGRAPLVLKQVDLAVQADKVVAQLRQRFPDRQVVVEIEQPLPALCDPSLLTIVLENLIGNAWKFTSQTPQATIRIGAAGATETAKAYVISDNGAGFDPAYADKLFKAFQRLHSAREFEGTGIGLAIVHRIIQRHGGRAWAESEPGKGARFHFSLPEEPGEGSVI
jgi:PAS domain S-box-containing protein